MTTVASGRRTIGVIGATGGAGRLICAEASARGHEVIPFVREASKVPEGRRDAAVVGDVLNVSRRAVDGLDVLVSAFGVPVERSREHIAVTEHLLDVLAGTTIRLIVVGSAGHLFVDERRLQRYWEASMHDGPLRDGARILEHAYRRLQADATFGWTYMAPAIEFVREGARTGRYRVGGDVVLSRADGRSIISYADYAIALVDEIETAAHPDRMITVCEG